jgi:hypothetical protein
MSRREFGNRRRFWLETRKTRDAVVPLSDDDREMRDGWRCIPVPPTEDDAWFIVDSWHDWKTVWGRWRVHGDGGRADDGGRA